MAYSSIIKPSDYFNTKLYTGNGGSSTDSITGINFQPDWVWIKARNNTYNHNLYDSVRSLSSGAILSNSTAAQDSTQRISSFDSDGFTLPATNYTYVNASGTNYVAWNWKANGAGVSNTDGSITSTVSASTTSGFSIVTYTGTGANATIGHGLGAVPSVVFVKKTSGTGDWIGYFKALGNTKNARLNTTDAADTNSTVWNSTTPTSSVFSVGTFGETNGSGATFVAYCFAEKTGFSKFGSYTGNASTDGPFVYCGFKPAFIMLKNVTTAQDWQMYTFDMQPFNEFCTTSAGRLKANTSDAESTKSAFDMLSNGFKMRTNATDINASGNQIIYMAFAEDPFVSNVDGGLPTTAR